MSYKYVKPKIISTKIRLRTDKYANYYEYYHNNSSSDDFLYKYLCSVKEKNMINEDFKSNFTEEGFNFKFKDNITCRDVKGNRCILYDILDSDIVAKLSIKPYDFVSKDGKHLSGITINLLEANAKYDK